MRKGVYSRSIFFLKIVMPLTALGLLATVFLFTTERTIPGGLTFSQADLETLEQGMQITKPRFSGSSEGGDVYNFTADIVFPDAPRPEIIEAVGLSGQIVYLQGTTMQLSAGKAEFVLSEKTMSFTEGISIVFSDGFRVTAENLLADLSKSNMTTAGPVKANSPMGVIESGNMRIETDLENDEESRMIWFEDGVRLSINVDE